MPKPVKRAPVQPKVKAAGLAGAVSFVLFAALEKFGVDTQASFDAFGFAFSVPQAVTAAAAFVAGYLKSDCKNPLDCCGDSPCSK